MKKYKILFFILSSMVLSLNLVAQDYEDQLKEKAFSLWESLKEKLKEYGAGETRKSPEIKETKGESRNSNWWDQFSDYLEKSKTDSAKAESKATATKEETTDWWAKLKDLYNKAKEEVAKLNK